MQHFLTAGADANARTQKSDGAGSTAAILALKLGHQSVCRVLLSWPGLDLTLAEREMGFTALHMACHLGREAAVRAMVGRPLKWEEANARDEEGRTPLMIAAK